MIKDLDIVELRTDLPDRGLKAGTIGTVVFDYCNGDAYEVEFVDRAGNTLDVVYVTGSQIDRISNEEAERKLGVPSSARQKPSPAAESR